MPQSKERKAQYQRDFRAREKGLQNEGTSMVGTSENVKENNVGDQPGQHPFYHMFSVIFTPLRPGYDHHSLLLKMIHGNT